MIEKRKAERLREFIEITSTIIAPAKISGEKEIFYNYSEDISASGAKLRGNINLPVDTLIQIDITLKNLQEKVTAVGKVRWIKTIVENNYYQAGVEFVNPSSETIMETKVYKS